MTLELHLQEMTFGHGFRLSARCAHGVTGVSVTPAERDERSEREGVPAMLHGLQREIYEMHCAVTGCDCDTKITERGAVPERAAG